MKVYVVHFRAWGEAEIEAVTLTEEDAEKWIVKNVDNLEENRKYYLIIEVEIYQSSGETVNE